MGTMMKRIDGTTKDQSLTLKSSMNSARRQGIDPDSPEASYMSNPQLLDIAEERKAEEKKKK
jgi:hypothetical protein